MARPQTSWITDRGGTRDATIVYLTDYLGANITDYLGNGIESGDSSAQLQNPTSWASSSVTVTQWYQAQNNNLPVSGTVLTTLDGLTRTTETGSTRTLEDGTNALQAPTAWVSTND